MMDMTWRILGIVLAASTIVIVLKETSRDMAYLLSLAVCGVVLFLLVEFADQFSQNFQRIFSIICIPEETVLPLFKMIAIAIITKIGADICRDAGEAAFGNLVETAGALTAILQSMPLFSAAWELLQELL